MNYKISKELFESVLSDGIEIEKEYEYIVEYNEYENTFEYMNKNTRYVRYSILVNDLYFECKKWVNKQGKRGYTIESLMSSTLGQARVSWYEKGHIDTHGQQFELYRYSEWFKCKNNNEQQAVFNACQWILDQLKENQ